MISNGLLYFILLAIVSITGHAAARATSSSARALRKDRERNAGKSNRKADRESRDANILSKKCTVPEDLGPGPGAHQAETEKVPEVGYRDVYDEKQEFQDFVRGWNQPQVQDIGDENPQLDCLPLFRSRTGEIVGMQPGAEGYSSQSSGETMEDMEKVELRRRRKQELRRSLRVVIPTGHTNKRIPLHARTVSDIPPSFQYYANRHTRTQSHSSTSIATPQPPIAPQPPGTINARALYTESASLDPRYYGELRGRRSPEKPRLRRYETECKVESNASGVAGPHPLVRAGAGMRMRYRGIERVGVLRVGRVEDRWVSAEDTF